MFIIINFNNIYIRNVYKALAKGANVNLLHETNAANNLVHQINSKIYGDHHIREKKETKILQGN